jgi:uncharacterized protein
MLRRCAMRRYVWMKDDPVGMEQAQMYIGPSGFDASAVALGTMPTPYRLDLHLATNADWHTRRLALTAIGDGWTRAMVLERDAAGMWTGTRSSNGAQPPVIDASAPADVIEPPAIPIRVLDVDVQYSPLTNLMPMRRLGLARPGASGAFTMAWVSVPSLAVTLDEQRYAILGVDNGDLCVRYEGAGGYFVAVIRCDAEGVVLDYPGIARRVR